MKKRTLFKTMLSMAGAMLFGGLTAQVTITGVTDSTAVLNDAFTAQVEVTGTPTGYNLLEAPDGMSINASGVISWTPSSMSAGGPVSVEATHGGGDDIFNFNVYVGDNVVCESGLLAYYPLDETNGTAFEDYMSPANTASALTALDETPGVVGNAQIMSPTAYTSQFLNITDNDQWEFAVRDEFSFSMWIYSDGIPGFATENTNQVLYSHYQYRASEPTVVGDMVLVGLVAQSGELYPRFRVKLDGVGDTVSTYTVDPSNPIPQGEWVHLACTYSYYLPSSQMTMTVYVNGTVAGSIMPYHHSEDNFYADGEHTIGYFDYPSATDAFNGSIDEFAIFTKALSSSEVAQIRTDGLSGKSVCQTNNHAPIFLNGPTAGATEDVAYSSTVLVSDVDGDDVNLTATVLPSWLDFDTESGELSSVLGPTNDDVGENTVTIQLNDGTVTVSKSFTITVANVNDAPVITSDPVTTATEDVEYTYEVVYEEIDEGDVVEVELVGPSWLTIAGNTITGTPTNAELGVEDSLSFPVQVTVTDGSDATDVQDFVLWLYNVNDVPIILSQLNLSTASNTAILLAVDSVFASDHILDPDNVFPDDFTLDILPGTGYSTSETVEGEWVTPDGGFTGVLEVDVMLSDGSEEVSWTININVENNAPVFISTITDTTIRAAQLFSYTLMASDADGDALTFNADVIPSWASLNASTGVLSGTPAESDVTDAPEVVLISVTDGVASDDITFTINVLPPSSIEGLSAAHLQLYPTPATDKVYIDLAEISGQTVQFEVLNLNGARVLQQSMEASNTGVVDISELRPGVYVYRVASATESYTGKLIKQ